MARVGEPVARQVGAELGLVVDLVPDDGVRLAGGAGRAHREDETTVPGHQQQTQDLEREGEGEGEGERTQMWLLRGVAVAEVDTVI